MHYEWDVSKAQANLRKHGVDFADAATVFSDDYALTIPDEEIEHEDRYVTIGMDALGRILVVVYTWRGETIRIISARKAERYERRQQEGQV
ncbi:MAG: BrnT family toxin [Chloroflexi bacterium]|nr:BrnT family toxin [Chloroflexota bacterium]